MKLAVLNSYHTEKVYHIGRSVQGKEAGFKLTNSFRINRLSSNCNEITR